LYAILGITLQQESNLEQKIRRS